MTIHIPDWWLWFMAGTVCGSITRSVIQWAREELR